MDVLPDPKEVRYTEQWYLDKVELFNDIKKKMETGV